MICLYAFNERRSLVWPIPGLTTKWFGLAIDNPGVRDALFVSVKAALGATAIALLLGSLAALAVARHRFFGREAISFLVILPIALPGIVTGMALNATFRNLPEPFGVELGLFTIMVGHATFCIVVVYNNVVARLRRTAASLEEASADLGADAWQTFRYVTFPQLKTALLAGALLAFALSFDEVIVTTFTAGADQTLPIWILNNLSRPNQLPIVNVVAVFVILLSMIPVYFASKLSSESAAAAAPPASLASAPSPSPCASSAASARRWPGSSTTKRRAFAELRLDPDRPVHPADELAADVEAEAGAADPTGHVRIEAVELLEDPAVLGGGDPEPAVVDREADRTVAVRDRERDEPALGRVLDRVVDEVDEHLPELAGVRDDVRDRLRRAQLELDRRRGDASGPPRRPPDASSTGSQLSIVTGSLAGVETPGDEQVVDDRPEPVGLGCDHAEQLVADLRARARCLCAGSSAPSRRSRRVACAARATRWRRTPP